jgi:hypothetical protein
MGCGLVVMGNEQAVEIVTVENYAQAEAADQICRFHDHGRLELRSQDVSTET